MRRNRAHYHFIPRDRFPPERVDDCLFLQTIESGTPLPTPSQKSSIDQILQAGWYLLELINEILDLALIELGKLSLSLEPISLSEVMLDCQAMIEPQAQKSNIQIGFSRIDNTMFVQADHGH